jgi:Mor family transcriptional regulator
MTATRRANIKEIIEIIGESAALDLVGQIGGATYYFPSEGEQGEHVSIDPEAWKAMCRHFSGWVYVPNCKAELIAIRDEEIRSKYFSGVHIVELVKEFRLSDRRIRHICSSAAKRHPELSRNESLPVSDKD